mmetsp:Transcript_6062/g.14990  ORF Transcript_6062/g.14990 Transcript_6062/m.14990 type:complete len:108 (+) Transcript_6062:957-1280(+)
MAASGDSIVDKGDNTEEGASNCTGTGKVQGTPAMGAAVVPTSLPELGLKTWPNPGGAKIALGICTLAGEVGKMGEGGGVVTSPSPSIGHRASSSSSAELPADVDDML